MTCRCIVLDYDNTIVDSFPDAQYGAMNYACDSLGIERYTKEELIEIDKTGRIGEDFRRKHPDEFDSFWNLFYEYLNDNLPRAYDGMKELLDMYRSKGGIICVVSNSTTDYIKKGMEFNDLPKPDVVYGWDSGEAYRKPNTTSLYEMSIGFGLSPMDILVVDDKPSGIDMANTYGTASCISGWGIIGDDQKDKMREMYPSSKFCDSVADLASELE